MVGYATFYPLGERKVVELAPALQTDPPFVDRARSFLELLGKKPEVVGDEAGLVLPRILALIINEAAFAYMEGTATAAILIWPCVWAPIIPRDHWPGRMKLVWTMCMRF